MKKRISNIILTVIVLFIGVSVWAQGPPPPPTFTDDTQDASSGGTGGGTGGTGGTGGSSTDTPLDGGLTLLLAAGTAYGARKRIKN